MLNYSCEDRGGDSETEEFRQSNSFSLHHHCTDATAVSTAPSHYLCSGFETRHQPIVFVVVKQIVSCPPLTPPVFFGVTGIFCSLDFIIQEKWWYLCVQILTNVCLCCCCLSATVDGWAGFRILNKLLFSFHTPVLCFISSAFLPHRVSSVCVCVFECFGRFYVVTEGMVVVWFLGVAAVTFHMTNSIGGHQQEYKNKSAVSRSSARTESQDLSHPSAVSFEIRYPLAV